MQGLADGYFVLPYTVTDYLAGAGLSGMKEDHAAFSATENEVQSNINRLIEAGKKGNRTVLEIYRDLGRVMWDKVGMARSDQGLKDAIKRIQELRKEFETGFKMPGNTDLNQDLELAGRVQDFLELGELMARDALHRRESCGGHFRVESQTPEGEAMRIDEEFTYAAAWEYKGSNAEPTMHKENLVFENIKLAQRSYK